MRIAVFGTGGVGGYFGGRLAQAGEDVTFIARGDHERAIREHGLRVDSINGDFTVQPAHVTADPAQVGPVDVVVVAVKSWQVSAAAEQMRPLIGPHTLVVPLLNGVEAPDQLAAVLGDEPVIGGLCRISAFVAGPGRIQHPAIAPGVTFGELTNECTERVEQLRAAFERANVAVDVPPDIHVAMWQKFLLIACWSGVGAITRMPVGAWRSHPLVRPMLQQALAEIVAVAQAHGIALSDNDATRTLQFIDSVPADTIASMQRDIMDGRPSELEAQNGAVVRLGAAAGVATPVHRLIYACLSPQEAAARQRADSRKLSTT